MWATAFTVETEEWTAPMLNEGEHHLSPTEVPFDKDLVSV